MVFFAAFPDQASSDHKCEAPHLENEIDDVGAWPPSSSSPPFAPFKDTIAFTACCCSQSCALRAEPAATTQPLVCGSHVLESHTP